MIWAPVIGCLAALSLWLVWRAPPRQVVETLWYSGGLLQPAAEPEPRVIRWPDVVSLRIGVHRSDDSPASIAVSTVCDHNGTSLTVLGPELARKAADLIVPAVVPGLIQVLDAGEPVSFGGLRIDRSGIAEARHADASAPVVVSWASVRRITVDARVTVKIWPADRRREIVIDLEGVPNGYFAHYLVEHAAACADIPVVHVDEKRFPDRLPMARYGTAAPPSAGTAADAIRDAASP